jgi:hypothetical protein
MRLYIYNQEVWDKEVYSSSICLAPIVYIHRTKIELESLGTTGSNRHYEFGFVTRCCGHEALVHEACSMRRLVGP